LLTPVGRAAADIMAVANLELMIGWTRRHLPGVTEYNKNGRIGVAVVVHRRLRQAHARGVRSGEKSVMRDAIRAKTLSALAAFRSQETCRT
jgi:hypothetical protein